MRSQGGLLLEDLMKIEWSSFELSKSHKHWEWSLHWWMKGDFMIFMVIKA